MPTRHKDIDRQRNEFLLKRQLPSGEMRSCLANKINEDIEGMKRTMQMLEGRLGKLHKMS